MNDDLEQTVNALEQEVEDELNSNHHPYQTITEYTCRLTIPDDQTTEVIIKTKSAGVAFATSPEDALNQTKTANHYSHQSYAAYILGYVRENLWDIDVADTNLIYTAEPTIKLMGTSINSNI
ncbi:MAG: hypothetical protein VCF07_07135 [Nitrospinota bacterium]